MNARYLLVGILLVFFMMTAKSKNITGDTFPVLSEMECQEDSVKNGEESVVYDKLDTPPHYPGGVAALMNYLSQNIRYPVEAQKKRIQGKVVVGFTIERDGSVTNVRVEEHSTSHLLDKEALRVVNTMSRWVPGRHNGRLVRSRAKVPVVFRM